MDNKLLKKHLHECLRREVMMSNSDFSWIKTLHKAFKCPMRRFNFWWRIASYLYNSDSYIQKKLATGINRRLIQKYNTEIQLQARIAPGLTVTHYLSIVINGCSVIGENFKIRQNTTIGISGSPSRKRGEPSTIIIGDNVEIGANSCIIGDNLKIGSNVIIGAMSFINKNIADNCIVFTEKHNRIITRDNALNSTSPH